MQKGNQIAKMTCCCRKKRTVTLLLNKLDSENWLIEIFYLQPVWFPVDYPASTAPYDLRRRDVATSQKMT